MVFKNKKIAPSSKTKDTIIGNTNDKLKNNTNMLKRFIIDLGFINFS
jgi:hypothetical protein